MFYHSENEFKESCGYVIDDTWYPRVTKIVDIKSKPSLYQFYSSVGFTNGNKIKEQSASEGTLVHEYVEKILLGENPTPPLVIKPAIDAFSRFFERSNIEAYPDLIEKRTVNYDFRYAGTVDALVSMNGRFGVLDIKTSKAIYRDYNLQTSAYFDALKRQFQNLEVRWILRIDQESRCQNCGALLRKKGGREKISRPFPDNGVCPADKHVWNDTQGVVELKELPSPHYEDFEAFLGAKKLWEWENSFWLKKIGYL